MKHHRECHLCGGTGKIEVMWEEQALIDMGVDLARATSVAEMIMVVCQKPFTIEAICSLINRQFKAVDLDEVHMKILNLEDSGFLCYNSTTGRYTVNLERYKEKD
jgi:hypothetical protein